MLHGVPPDFPLKFNPGPAALSHQGFISLKQQIIEKAVEHGVRLFAYVVLHDIAKSPDEARRNGVNTVLYHFDCYLNRKKDDGLVLLDRFTDKGNKIDAHTREKFAVGLLGLPYSSRKRLRNILGVHYSTIGQSHFCSLVDIIVGSLRFAMNAHTRNQSENKATAASLLQLISPMFFREEGAWASEEISELGLSFSPKGVRSASYRAKYEQLKAFLEQSGVGTAQVISDHARY